MIKAMLCNWSSNFILIRNFSANITTLQSHHKTSYPRQTMHTKKSVSLFLLSHVSEDPVHSTDIVL